MYELVAMDNLGIYSCRFVTTNKLYNVIESIKLLHSRTNFHSFKYK